MRYKARLAYDGTSFAGWQVQQGADTVQGVLEKILSKLFRKEISVTGCGRTDAGVHATNYYIHFDAPEDYFRTDELVYKINRMTPSSIALYEIVAAPGFHARFDALKRYYSYHIHAVKNPFLHAFSFHHPPSSAYSLTSLNATARLLLDYKDFATFCKTGSDVKTTLCEISDSHWCREGDRLIYNIAANRFLRGMVRLLVGSMLLIEEGQITRMEWSETIAKRARLRKDWSIPSHGLRLTGVDYPKKDNAL